MIVIGKWCWVKVESYLISIFKNMNKKLIIAISVVSLLVATSTMAAILPPPPTLPASKDDCKKEDGKTYNVFKNQGDCVSLWQQKGRISPTAQIKKTIFV